MDEPLKWNVLKRFACTIILFDLMIVERREDWQ